MPTGSRIALTASGDNRANGFALDRLSSTKYLLYLVMMELAEQLRDRNLLLSLAWRPRDENEEADALTNGNFGAFTPEKRINVKFKDLPLKVLPGLTAAAEELFHKVREQREARKAEEFGGPRKAKRRRPLKESDPW